MSEVLLREAARVIRESWDEAAEKAGWMRAKRSPSDPFVGTMAETMIEVAAWLEDCADRRAGTSSARIQHDVEEQAWYQPACKVAAAYLGPTSTIDPQNKSGHIVGETCWCGDFHLASTYLAASSSPASSGTSAEGAE